MSFALNVPPSLNASLAKKKEDEGGDAETDGTMKKSRDEMRKERELDELRKLGSIPALTDETGKDINPHIPQYVSQVPWYYNSLNPTLRHQRMPDEMVPDVAKVGEFSKRGIIPTEEKRRKFKPGACTNCGAMTHKAKGCLERPRKLGAKFTNRDIAPDEYIPEQLKTNFEGKRDRWQTYDIEKYKHEVIAKHDQLEQKRNELKNQKLEEKMRLKAEEAAKEGKDTNDINLSSDSSDSEADEKYAEQMSMPGQKFKSTERQTVRNLRIREDTAKYLLNLDPESAHYDPKTRAMRDNPFADGRKTHATFQGDNQVRYSGDANKFAKAQLFAWEAYQSEVDIHAQADPTKTELLMKEVTQRKDKAQTTVKDSVAEKYGGKEYINKLPKTLVFAQTEEYKEYDPASGKLLSKDGEVIPMVSSSYKEDVYKNNHTTVFGSYWDNFKWGYKCCHSFIKNSYCTGLQGEEAGPSKPLEEHVSPNKGSDASDECASNAPNDVSTSDHEEVPLRTSETHVATKSKSSRKKKRSRHSKKRKRKRSTSSSSSDTDHDVDSKDGMDRRKIMKAMKRQEKEEKIAGEILQLDERKRPYNSMKGDDDNQMSKEEVEAYRLRKVDKNDPMAEFFKQKQS